MSRSVDSFPWVLACTVALATPSLVALAQDTPRLPNGRPDLNGVWFGGFQPALNASTDGTSVCLLGCNELEDGDGATPRGVVTPPPERPSYQPEYLAKVAELDARQVEEDPVLRCENPGLPRIGAPDKIVQNAHEAVFLYDDVNGSFWRIVPTDGRRHREDLEPTYLGDAVGRWDGDTLVVDTINFNDETWLTDDGSFHTKNLRVVERLTRRGNTLEYEVTAYDPAVLTEPWVKAPMTLTLSDVELVESPPCRERDLPLMQDLSSHDNPR
jgi:hypothetical protein